jgi:hypothetical protein
MQGCHRNHPMCTASPSVALGVVRLPQRHSSRPSTPAPGSNLELQCAEAECAPVADAACLRLAHQLLDLVRFLFNARSMRTSSGLHYVPSIGLHAQLLHCLAGSCAMSLKKERGWSCLVGQIGLVRLYRLRSFNENLDREVRVQLVGRYMVGEETLAFFFRNVPQITIFYSRSTFSVTMQPCGWVRREG